MLEWFNFLSLLSSIFFFSLLYLFSLQPVKMEEKTGDRAWKICMILRSIAGAFEFVIVLNIIMWMWFPISLFNWKIHQNQWTGIIISLLIAIPGIIIMIKGIFDAGIETTKPSKDTDMYGGIYKYIRHPQSLGEFSIFIAFGFSVNSWFLVLIFTCWAILYVPIMIHYEEKDLIRKFGEFYIIYRKNTGALIPKIRKKKNSKRKN